MKIMFKRMESINLPMIVVLIGGVVVTVGGLVVTIGTFFVSYKQNEDQTKIANERAAFEKELRIKAEKIAELTETAAASVTGGDSYCYISLSIDSESKTITPVLQNTGKYPMYAVGIRIVPLHFYDKLGEAAVINLNGGNVPPNSALPLTKISFPSDAEKLAFTIQMSARNGHFTESVRLQKVNGIWKRATVLYKSESSEEKRSDEPKPLFEEISEGFPRNEQGKVDWQYVSIK